MWKTAAICFWLSELLSSVASINEQENIFKFFQPIMIYANPQQEKKKKETAYISIL